MKPKDPYVEHGEYGPPADVYRRFAGAYNRARIAHPKYPQEGDTSFVAITLRVVDGDLIPSVYQLYDAVYAREWWGRHMPEDIFYAALFNNEWASRGSVTLAREYLRGGKWLGPMRPPGLAM